MVALSAENPEAIDILHAKALELEAANEGDPGPWGKSSTQLTFATWMKTT